jgi:preprotein translocase SecE subunit
VSEKRLLKQKDTAIIAPKVKKTAKRFQSVRKVVRRTFSPLRFMLKPLRWIGKHLVPKYFKNSYAELKLVTWTPRKESRQLTTAVILFAIVLGFSVTLVDYGLDKVFKKVVLKQ